MTTAIATREDEAQRELETELDAAKREYDDALRAFRGEQQRETELNTSRTLTTASGERVVVEDTPEAFVLAREEIEQAKREAAHRLRDARQRLLCVLVEHGNTALAAQAPEHEAAAAAVTTARERFERAWAMFVLAGWGLNEALVAESRQAQKLIVTAMESVCDDEERGRLRHGAKDRVPLHLDDGGAVDEWRDRPSAMLFEGADAANNPKSHALYSDLGELVRAGRERGHGCLRQVRQGGTRARCGEHNENEESTMSNRWNVTHVNGESVHATSKRRKRELAKDLETDRQRRIVTIMKGEKPDVLKRVVKAELKKLSPEDRRLLLDSLEPTTTRLEKSDDPNVHREYSGRPVLVDFGAGERRLGDDAIAKTEPSNPPEDASDEEKRRHRRAVARLMRSVVDQPASLPDGTRR